MASEEVKKLIEQAAAEGWTELDLSMGGFNIAQPQNLTFLSFAYNQITEIPEAIALALSVIYEDPRLLLWLTQIHLGFIKRSRGSRDL